MKNYSDAFKEIDNMINRRDNSCDIDDAISNAFAKKLINFTEKQTLLSYLKSMNY